MRKAWRASASATGWPASGGLCPLPCLGDAWNGEDLLHQGPEVELVLVAAAVEEEGGCTVDAGALAAFDILANPAGGGIGPHVVREALHVEPRFLGQAKDLTVTER